MPDVAAQIELAKLRAEQRVKERYSDSLKMLLLQRDSLSAQGRDIPDSLIAEISTLHDRVFNPPTSPCVPKPIGPQNVKVNPDGRIATFLHRCFA